MSLWRLSGHAAFSALHDSELRGQRTGVHEGTRESFIEKLGGWIEDPDGKGRVYWIRGGAGVGKSAVAQTICEKYAGSRLAAAHFFSRNVDQRNSMDRFIPTIAYQLAESHGPNSPLTSKINDVLNANPRIMEMSWEEQFKRLICAPCAAIDAELWTDLPRLIVIDGIDECMDRDPQTNEIDWKPGKREGQRRLLSMIQNATSTQPSFPLHFLIFSRPEHTISTFFRSRPFIPSLEEFDMRELRAQADADIELYLRAEFARFPDSHPDMGLDTSWPGEVAIRKLTLNADGHFIYVVTAVKYVAGDDPILLLPQDRLAVLLRTSETLMYPDLSTLDQLYHHILQPYMGSRKEILLPILQLIIHSPQHTLPEIMGFTTLGDSSMDGLKRKSRYAIAQLLKLDSRQVSAILSRLRSILYVPDDEHREDVSVLHASFPDFLRDKQRSHHFHVEPLKDHAYFTMVSECLLPILTAITRRYRAGQDLIQPSTTTQFELWSLDVWVFVGLVFGIGKHLTGQEPPDDYVCSKELLFAINEFQFDDYVNMLLDRKYIEQFYTLFPNLIEARRTFSARMDAFSAVMLINVPFIRGLYTAFTAGKSLSSYRAGFCLDLSLFIDKQRSFFADGWLVMLPKTTTSSTLSKLALLIGAGCSPLLSGETYFGQYSDVLKLPLDTDDITSYVSFKIFPLGTYLAEVPEGSDVWNISCEKGRILVDKLQRLGHNLGGSIYSEAARERGIRAFTKPHFAGLDDWNREISMLLDLWPSREGYDAGSDFDWGDFSGEVWDFDDDNGVSLEPAIPDTKLEDTEGFLDYGREFPWRLKTPRHERLSSNQSKSAAEPWQIDDDERSDPVLNVVWGGRVPIGKDGSGHEKDKEITPRFSVEVSMKDSENERGPSTRSEDKDLPQHEPCGLPEASEVGVLDPPPVCLTTYHTFILGKFITR
ncbi:hypothetical protein V5O48_007475 [Marasmius crinis-equi]|uniref:Nephrocystin 3-like N-terminal domain-containing protein n=1 Tax=Marasmius crinis-equi TaxID=585013 RepID=A0ABR3FGK2_9AGAR